MPASLSLVPCLVCTYPVRREANTCSICWFPANPAADFAVSGSGMMGITNDALCCGYGLTGLDERGYDCLLIPMASNTQMAMIKANRFCGASKGLATIGSQLGVGTTTITELDRTICCKWVKLAAKLRLPASPLSTLSYIHIVTILWLNPIPARYLPFQIRFVSDSYEFADEAVNAPQGFKLQYRLQHCT